MQIVGPVKYNKLVHVEIDRVKRLAGTGIRGVWKLTGEELEGGSYEARYGADWKKEIRKVLAKTTSGYMCVTDLMDHVIHHGNEMFADTPYKDNW